MPAGSIIALLTLLLCAVSAAAAGKVTLKIATRHDADSPAQVGDTVSVAADVPDPSGNYWYRFRVRYLGPALDPSTAQANGSLRGRAISSDFTVVRDYSPVDTLDWSAAEREGDYELELTTRNNDTGEISVTSSVVQFAPRVSSGGTPVVSATGNSMVMRYSAAPCASGNTMRVEFTSPDGTMQSTPAKRCDGATTMNFYLAGMGANTQYSIQHVIEGGSQPVNGPVLTQTTPDVSDTFGPYSVVLPPADPSASPILLQSRGGWPVATDLAGNLLWYYPEAISYMSRPRAGGLFFGWYEDQTSGPEYQILREFDLTGTATRETNAARVSEQLVSMGMHAINSFHHEIRALANDQVLALASEERILTDVQGPGPVDVLGDVILVLDRNLQVLWAWDTFDHLDTHRLATLNETCNQVANGCAPIYLAPIANDWTHGNAVQLTPDGNILFSSRHQDWLIKIDYRNGEGTGDILWRLGKDGDFQIVSGDPSPWFSHQHDANIDANGLLTVFDNGNLRYAADPSAHSRGQALQLDEQNMTATAVLNADLGDFSVALGSAQRLPNGNFHFHLGYLLDTSTARVVEVDPSGNIVYRLDIGELEYRSFRRKDMYTD